MTRSPNSALEYPLHHAQMSHLYLHLLRAQRTDYAPELTLPVWNELCPVLCQVLIGHVENRPMTKSDLARFLEMSRRTVGRRLQALIKLGILERHGQTYWLVKTRDGEAFKEFWQHLLHIVEQITKLEANP